MNISEATMRQLREEANRRGTTVSALAEATLRNMFEVSEVADTLRPLPTYDAGEVYVDVADRPALYEAMGE